MAFALNHWLARASVLLPTIILAMDSLSPCLQGMLIADGWNVMLLDTAFDTEAEALALVNNLDGNHETQVVCQRWAIELTAWQVAHVDAARRCRARISSADIVERVSTLHSLATSSGYKPSSLTVSSVLKLCLDGTKVHWRTRRSKKLALAGGADERSRIEQTEKARWAEKLVGFLMEANAPVLAHASLTAILN